MTRIEVLDALGFIKELESLSKLPKHWENIHFTFQTDTTDYIPGEQSITPYRIIRPALRNAVTLPLKVIIILPVDITKQKQHIIKISDDGMGLDIQKKNRYYLFDMRERAAMLRHTILTQNTVRG